MIHTWWNKRQNQRPRRSCRPALETLEDRSVPATFAVTNLNDAGIGSLRQAIADANGTAEPNAIVFQSGLSGTITLTTGQLHVTRSVTMTGPGSAKLTVSGNNTSRVFLVDDRSDVAQNVAISGLTLTQGNAGNGPGGALNVASENLVLTDVAVTGSVGLRGGGINVATFGRLTLENCWIAGNRTTSIEGGASTST